MRVWAGSVVVALVLALVAAGCGGGGGGGKTSAADWVHTVCTSIGSMKNSLTSGQAKLQSSLQGITSGGKADLKKARDVLVSFLSDLENAVKKAQSEIAGAGTPDVDKGADLEKALNAALDKVVGGVDAAKQKASQLSTTDQAAFVRGTAAVAQIGNTIGSSLGVLSRYSSDALDKAAQADSACKALSG